MPRGASIFRVLIILVLLGGGTLVAAAWYLNHYFLPEQGIPTITKELRRLTGRDVLVSGVRYRLFEGFIVTDLAIVDPTSQQPWLTVEETTFQPLWLPLLQKRRLIIPTLTLSGARVRLVRQEDGQWDVPTIKTGDASEPPVLIRKIELHDAVMGIEDRSAQPALARELRLDHAELRLTVQAELRFKVKGTIVESNTAVHCWGYVIPKTRAFTLHGSIDHLPLSDLAPYVGPSLPIQAAAGQASGLIDVQLSPVERSFSWRGRLEDAQLAYQTSALRGTLQGEVMYRVPVPPSTEPATAAPAPTYQAAFTLADGRLEGLPVIGQWDEVQADIAITPDELVIRSLRGTNPRITGTLKGTMTQFAQPHLELDGQFDLDLALAESWLRERGPASWRQVVLSGRAQADLHLSGVLGPESTPAIRGTLRLTGAQARLPELAEPLTQVTGTLRLEPDRASTDDLRFQYRQSAFTASGDLRHFAAPQIMLDLSSDWLTLALQVTQRDRVYDIRQCEGQWHHSPFRLTGTVYADEPLTAALTGTAAFDLHDLAWLGEPWKAQLAPWRLEGATQLTWEAAGPLRTPSLMQWTLQGASPLLMVKGYHLPNLQFTAQFTDQRLAIKPLTAQPYRGTLQLVYEGIVGQADRPFTLSGYVEGIQLGELVQDLPTQRKAISGRLTGRVDLQGLGSSQATWTGQGAVQIKEGNLWEIPLMSGIPGLLFPDLRRATFSEGSGTFTISNNRITSRDLTLSSPAADLVIAGHVGFDHAIDATIGVRLAKFEGDSESEASRLAAATLNLFRSLSEVTEFHVTGTLSQPKVDKLVRPTKLVDDLLQRVLPE